EDARVGQRRALRRRRAAGGEAAVARAAVDAAVGAVQAAIDDGRFLPAVAQREAVVVGRHEVALDVEGVDVLLADDVLLEVGRTGAAGARRVRDEADDRARDRAEPGGRDDVVDERRASAAFAVAGRGIVDLHRLGREVALAERDGRDRRLVHLAEAV